MTDNKFNEVLIKLNKAHSKYLNLLRIAEEEYKRRFGNYPADVDDDFWIDSFCQSDSGAKLENVMIHGALANER
jgi:hypothetical protein